MVVNRDAAANASQGDEIDALSSHDLAQQLGAALRARHWQVTCAESCTGGGVAVAMTAIAGSSAWFEQGFVTYSNAAKTAQLGVAAVLLQAHGAVSEAVVQAMALGARQRAGADVSVAISGIAGPDGGSAEKPVGTVWLAWSTASGVQAQCFIFAGDRHAVRTQAVQAALAGLLATVNDAAVAEN
ncbi:MAG: CinA family protein [Aeromonas sp.]